MKEAEGQEVTALCVLVGPAEEVAYRDRTTSTDSDLGQVTRRPAERPPAGHVGGDRAGVIPSILAGIEGPVRRRLSTPAQLLHLEPATL